MKKFAIVLLSVLVFVALSFSLVVAQEATPEPVDRTGWPETFIIGVYPGDNVEAALASNEPLRTYLESALGVRTVIITGTSYNAVVEAMAAGRADAFEVGPFSYTLAAQVANAEAIAVGTYSTDRDLFQNRVPGYYSLMFTKKGSGITSIDDLAGRSFTFTDPASTSGYLVPATDILLDQEFSDPAQIEDFAAVSFAGNHPASVLAVWNGNVDAGATFDDNLATQVAAAGVELCGFTDMNDGDLITAAEWPYKNAMTEEEIMAIYNDCPDGSLVVFHQSPLIPQTPFAINAALPETFKTAVYDALMDLVNHPDIVDVLGRYYMDPTAVDPSLESIDAVYNPLRDIARLLNLDLTAR